MCFILFALFFFSANVISMAATSDKLEIKILATSDMHNTFYPYDYARDSDYLTGGLGRVASVIKKERTTNTILIDNGDTIQGIASLLNMDDDVGPMIKGMNALGYDVWSSGNHEFNYGVPFLEKTIASFNGQFLLANVYDKANERLRGAKNYTIVERSGVKIAVIGVVTPNITRWDKANLAEYRITDPKDEVEAAVAEIQAKNAVDLIVVSFHASVGGEYEGLTDAAVTIARDVPHIDAVIAGHEHSVVGELIQGKNNPVPIVEPGRFGDYVSEIKLNVQFDGERYRVADYDNDIVYRNIKTANYDNDHDMMELLAPFHVRALDDARTVIGELRDGPLVPKADIEGITQAQIEDTPLLDLILKVQLQAVEAQGVIPQGARHVSGAALFSANANVAKGPITKAGSSSIYRFDNTLMTVKTTGVGLKRYMEWSASYYNKFVPGDLTISFDPAIRIYNYDMFAGVHYTVNVSKPVGERIEGLQYGDGTIVNDTDVVYVTVNNYRANTHLLSDLLSDDATIVYDSANENGGTVREKIVQYIEDRKTIYPEVDHNWYLTGYTWNDELHNVVRRLVARGDLTIPQSKDGRTPNVQALRRTDIVAAANVIDLLSLNDFHGAIEETEKNIGAVKLGGVIKEKRAENEQTFLLGAGDLFQGSAMSNLTEGEVVSVLLREYGMVYSAIGNHEFDWTISSIPAMAQKGNFEFLAANIVEKSQMDKKTNEQTIPAWAKPYAILNVGDKKIGLIGLTTPATAYQTVPKNVENLIFLDPIATARKWEQYLRNEKSVDLVFALTHIGSEQQGEVITGEAADLARGVPTLDGIFSSHSHRFVEGKVNDVPIVQGGFNGRGLSNISIIYTNDGEKLAVVPTVERLSDKIDQLPTDEASQRIVDLYRAKVGPILDEVIGVNHQSLPHDYIQGENVSAMGQATAKMMQEIMGTDLALINGGGIRAGLDEGAITVGDMYTLFPFDNTIATVELNGRQLKQLIEHGINPSNFRSGQFYGVDVWYTLERESVPRVNSMRLLNGEKIEDNKIYRVATIDFLLAGGDWYDFTGAMNIKDTGEPLRDKLIAHIKMNEGISHKFTQSLILGLDPTSDEESALREGLLTQTGRWVSEVLLVSLLFVVVSSLYLKQRWRVWHNK